MAGNTISDRYKGLQDAEVSDSLPKLADGTHHFEVTEIKDVDGFNGQCVVCEGVSLSSDTDQTPGSVGSITINGFDDKERRGKAMGRLKALLAACSGYTVDAPIDWIAGLRYAVEQRAFVGARFYVQVATKQSRNADQKTGKPFEYKVYFFEPDEANPKRLA